MTSSARHLQLRKQAPEMSQVEDFLFDGLRACLGDRFEVDPKEVGSGGTCRVYAACSYSTGAWVAIKAFRKPIEKVGWLIKVRAYVS